MRINDDPSSPVVIGGVGGSGTRVVAEIIDRLGFYLGGDLNRAKDNLWFLLLFKRPRWYLKSAGDPKTLFTGFSLLRKSLLDNEALTRAELNFLMRAVFQSATIGHSLKGRGSGLWPFARAAGMLWARPKRQNKNAGWGWKEPNTQIYLAHLADYFRRIRYIHVIRHGLDMAFSQNQQQLYNWGPIFGVSPPKTKTEEPAASLKYWVKSNQHALKIGEKMGPGKYLAVSFEKLCLSPRSELERIASFVKVQPSRQNFEKAVTIPQRPKSMGRHRAHDIGQFDSEDLQRLNRINRELETP